MTLLGFTAYGSKSKSYRRAKAEPRSKQKMMGEGVRGKGIEKNRLHSTPWEFCYYIQKVDVANGIPDWPTECQPVSGCQIPSGHKLWRSTVSCNAACCIWPDLCLLKEKYSSSVFDTSSRSSAALKLQRTVLKSKRGVSEKGDKLLYSFISENNSNQQLPHVRDLCLLNLIHRKNIWMPRSSMVLKLQII